jgi:hypothetical protein
MEEWGREVLREGKEFVGWKFADIALDQQARGKFARSKTGGPSKRSLAAYCRAVEVMMKFDGEVPAAEEKDDVGTATLVPAFTAAKKEQAGSPSPAANKEEGVSFLPAYLKRYTKFLRRYGLWAVVAGYVAPNLLVFLVAIMGRVCGDPHGRLDEGGPDTAGRGDAVYVGKSL